MLIGGAVAGAIAIGNTGHSTETPIDTTKRAWVSPSPRTLNLTAQDRQALLRISTKWVQTAVARKRVDDAWELAGPELRQGESRSEWDTGNIAVVPFTSTGIAAWDLLYSYPGDVALDLALIGDKRQRWLSKTFTIEFRRHGARWLVASWTPRGISSYTALKPSARPEPLPPVKAPLSRWYLLVPAGILTGLLFALALFGLLRVARGRRAARRYAQVLGQSSSSSPS